MYGKGRVSSKEYRSLNQRSYNNHYHDSESDSSEDDFIQNQIKSQQVSYQNSGVIVNCHIQSILQINFIQVILYLDSIFNIGQD